MDAMFSEIIRKRAINRAGGCERCGSQKHDVQKDNGAVYPAWKQLQCSHIIGRSNFKVRWDTNNAFGLCAGCHMYLEHHPLEHTAFAREKLGQELDMLHVRSQAKGKTEFSLIWLYLKELAGG